MTLTIYGHPVSRTSRTIWMAYELGLEFENVPVSPRTGDARKPEHLAINPNGHVPAIDDDGFVLWESLAINIYLAKKHGGPLAPADLEEETRINQWSMWALTECETACVTLIQQHNKPDDEKDTAGIESAKASLVAPLGVLEAELASRDWLVGDRFSVADLNVACALSPLMRVDFDLGPYPKISAWLETCHGRPAAAQAREMGAAAMKAAP
jgi:glutathione S-transferase